MWRRIAGALFFIVGLFSQHVAFAQYPTKPVHIVVPYPAGGAVDAFARILSQRLSESVGPTSRRRQSAGRQHHDRS